MAQITEMTKPDHSAATARVKSAEKMVMLPPLFDGTKPEVTKQHYERFNQLHNPISHNCAIVSPHKLNSSELHCQGEARSSQYSELAPEAVTLQ